MTLSDINEEMKATADYAIKSAKDRYGLELDYSEESLAVLDNVLEKIYWGFSSRARDNGESGLIYNTAIIWGSYLGEYMCLKWGGTWVLNGTDRRVSITSIEFSPISYVYQKITNHPEYSIDNYAKEAKRVIYASVIHPKKIQPVIETIAPPKPEIVSVQPKPEITSILKKIPFTINKRVMYISGAIISLLVIIGACITGYRMIRSGGFPAFGLFADVTSTYTAVPTQAIIASATLIPTDTPTATPLPTYTPKPTNTPRPTHTPISTDTPIPTWTPTETETPIPPDTDTPVRTPTNTKAPPTNPPPPPPTDTPLPPITLVSCLVSPDKINRDQNTKLTFSVQFSRGSSYGFTASPTNYGSGCSGQDNGSGSASCTGESGNVPGMTTVSVTFTTPVGDCVDKYSSN